MHIMKDICRKPHLNKLKDVFRELTINDRHLQKPFAFIKSWVCKTVVSGNGKG